MSSVLANANRARSWSWSRALWRELEAFGLCFAVVSLATTVFVLKAVPGQNVLPLSQPMLATFVLGAQLTPALLLFAADRIVRARWPALHPRFRGLVFGLGPALLLLHVLGALIDRGAYVDEPGTVLLFGLLAVPVAWAPVRLATLHTPAATTLYRFLIPAAVVPTVLFVGQDRTAGLPVASAAAPVEQTYVDPLPTTFLIILDEMSYPSILGEDGSIDAQRYPNLAALASESAVVPDATAHRFYTRAAVPELLNSVAMLSDRADISLYIQYAEAEIPLRAGCGVRYACAGISALTEERPAQVLGQLLLSLGWEATPGPLRSLGMVPLGWLADLSGQPQSVADPQGLHLFTEQMFDDFIAEAAGAEPEGDIMVLHSLVTHGPYIFDADGRPSGGANRWYQAPGADDDATYEHYRTQLEYADAKLGQLLAVLRANGRLDDSYLILTSDHGLRRGSVLDRPPPPVISEEPTSIPLLIRGPGVQPGAYEVDYSHTDFDATLRDLLGLAPPSNGVSAFEDHRPEDRSQQFLIHSSDNTIAWHYERQPGEDTWHLVRTEDLTAEDDTED